MQEIKVNSKFGIGARVITVKNKSVEYMCSYCNGIGQIYHKGKNRICNHCGGSGKLHTHEKVWEVDAEPMEISGIRIFIDNNGNESISYVFHSAKGNRIKRSENHCFVSVEEAQAYCGMLNAEIREKVKKEIQILHDKYDVINREIYAMRD